LRNQGVVYLSMIRVTPGSHDGFPDMWERMFSKDREGEVSEREGGGPNKDHPSETKWIVPPFQSFRFSPSVLLNHYSTAGTKKYP